MSCADCNLAWPSEESTLHSNLDAATAGAWADARPICPVRFGNATSQHPLRPRVQGAHRTCLQGAEHLAIAQRQEQRQLGYNWLINWLLWSRFSAMLRCNVAKARFCFSSEFQGLRRVDSRYRQMISRLAPRGFKAQRHDFKSCPRLFGINLNYNVSKSASSWKTQPNLP